MLDGLLPEELALGVGALKSSDVTLKQGTFMEKLIVSTKVCGASVTLTWIIVLLVGEGEECQTRWRETHDISTSKERLVVAVVLPLELRPVLQLDCGIGAGGDTFEAVDGVTLVAWVDVCDIAHDLVVKVCL